METIPEPRIIFTTPDGRQVDVSEHVTEISLIGPFSDEVIRVIKSVQPLLARNTQKATGHVVAQIESHYDTNIQETECDSPTGITVGLIDAIITNFNLLLERDLSPIEVQEAIKDLKSNSKVLSLLGRDTHIHCNVTRTLGDSETEWETIIHRELGASK